jgi:hypothetical protein
MRFRIAVLLAASLALGGCSTLDGVSDIFGFPSGDEAPQAPAATGVPSATATAQAAGPDQFCRSVAAHDALVNDFDKDTQAKMAQKSYAQCVALFGGH